MANKSLRIPTIAGGNDKYVTVRLENEVDFYEILSLKISQKDVYGTFNSDYGVIVGRVIANGGIGIPNVKLSIFIPISDEDKMRAEISAIYPYSSPRDKDLDGVRYNLLPRVSVNNPFIEVGRTSPRVPIGTFPTKEEITANESFLEVYEKYYKFTTVTNQSGDYMFFGVPIGIQTVHMSVDITDIGIFSMTPGTMISSLGYSPNLFTDNGGQIKYGTDLEILPNVETQEIAVEVRPFWGDTENFEIGITRQDFKIRATVVASFSIFGSVFTDAYSAGWGSNGMLNRMTKNDEIDGSDTEKYEYNLNIVSKRNGDVNVTLFTIPSRISDANVVSGNFDTAKDIVAMDKNEYSTILDSGQFILTAPCNRTKKVMNESGELVITTDDDVNGIFTEFYGFITIKYGANLTNVLYKSPTDGNRIDITRIKIPQSADRNPNNPGNPPTTNATLTFGRGALPDGDEKSLARNERWRKQAYKFSFGELYGIAKFNGTVWGEGGEITDPNAAYGPVNQAYRNPARNSGAIICNDIPDFTDEIAEIGFVPNRIDVPIDYGSAGASGDPKVPVFAAEWLNFSIYLPQFRATTSSNTDASDNLTDYKDNKSGMVRTNTQLVGGIVKDTNFFLRSDYHPTDFIHVPKSDIVKMATAPKKGYTNEDSIFISDPLTGTDYKSLPSGSTKYFFKGIGTADCIQFLIENGIV